MIAETKHPEVGREPCPHRLDAELYHFATPKKTGAAPSAGDEKEVSAQRLKREHSAPKPDPDTRQRKGDLKC